MRVVSRARLRADECAYPLNVVMPDAWGRVVKDQPIEIDMPGPPTVAKGKPSKLD
jgi:hypothetical protein